jgi:hypothetical protein
VYGLPEVMTGPPPGPQIGSEDPPSTDVDTDEEARDGVDPADGSRWDVCDYADFADAEIDGSSVWERNIARACEQVRAGQQPDRPDIVACYSRTDEPGGSLAGEIATETCDRLAERDTPIPVDQVDDLARSRPYGTSEAALSAWEPTTPPPDAVQLLAPDPGEPAWYASDDATDPEAWRAHGLAAWDERLGADAARVCAWIAEEVVAVIDDGAEIVTNDPDAPVQYAYTEPEHQAASIVLNNTLDGAVGDGLTPIVIERCDP